MKNKGLPSPKTAEPAPGGAGEAPRRKFTDEFKRMAVARSRESGTNVTLLALELGVRRKQIYEWAKKLDTLEPGKPLRTPGRPPASEESEVVRLRRELARANEELAVLKKFDAYLTRLKK